MGKVDRVIRIIIAIILLILVFTGKIEGLLAIILGVVSAVFLVTSLIGWCPLYTLLGISTQKKET